MMLEKRQRNALVQYLLVLACLLQNVEAEHHGMVKGRPLRRQRGLKVTSPKRTMISSEDDNSPSRRQFKTKTGQGSEFSKSRVGVLGQEKNTEDPFVQAAEDHNGVSPFEQDVDTSEFEFTTTDPLVDTSTPPPTAGDTKEAWDFTQDTISSNFTSITYTTVVSGNQELVVTKLASPTKMPTPGPTFEPTRGAIITTRAPTDTPLAVQLSPPTRLPTWTGNSQSATSTGSETFPTTPLPGYWMTPTPVSLPPSGLFGTSDPFVVSKAKEAGENMVAGVTQTLAQGKLGAKGPKGVVKSKEATTAQGTNPKGVTDKGVVAAAEATKGGKNKEATASVGATNGLKGAKSKEATAAKGANPKGVADQGVVAAKEASKGGKNKEATASVGATKVSSAKAAPAPKVKGVKKSRSQTGGFSKAAEANQVGTGNVPGKILGPVNTAQEANQVGTGNLPGKILGPVSMAQEAGQSIVAGVTGNLLKGKKGPKGAKSKEGAASVGTTNVSSAQEAPAKEVKKISKSKAGGANAVFWNSKFQKSKKSAKSSDGAVLSSAFGVGEGGKGGKGGGGKKSASGGGSILSAFGTPVGGGKGGKGGKGKSSFISSTFEPPTQGVSAPTQPSPPPRTNTPAPVPVISSVIGAPVPDPTAAPTAPGQSSPGVDCDAIAKGTASTEADNQSTFTAMADWLLEEGAEFEVVARDVQQYLQSEIAPAMAGCEIKRRRKKRRLQRRSLQFITASALITNVLFGTPTSEGEGTCVIDQVERCYAVEGDVDMYYYGSDRNLGMRLLTFLRAGIYNEVDGLLGVVNLKVFDSNGNEVEPATNAPAPAPAPASIDVGTTGTGDNTAGGDNQGSSGTGTSTSSSTSSSNGGTDALVGDEEPQTEGISSWSKTLIGVSSATAFLAFIICFYAYRQCQAAEEIEREGKLVQFGNLVNDDGSDQEVPTNNSQAPTTNGVFYLDDHPSRTWPDNEDDQSNDSEELEQVLNPIVCAPDQPRVKFISSTYEPEQLPEDATRNYYVKDTVAL